MSTDQVSRNRQLTHLIGSGVVRGEALEEIVAMELRKVVVMARFTLNEMCETYLCCQRSLLNVQTVA